MKRAAKKLLIATSIAAGMGGIFTAPALAGSLTNSSIGGADDYLVYDSNGSNTFLDNSADLQTVLNGNAGNPGGNVELAASSEQDGFDFTKNTTLEGKIGGKDITLSSLTEDDWNSTDANGMSFGERWFNEALIANGFGILLNPVLAPFVANSFGVDDLFSAFKSEVGLERFSDPNISYVNQDMTGEISIGLAGHYDAKSIPLLENLLAVADGFRDPSKRGTAIQVSEVVKVTYNDKTDFLYSFEATDTKQTDMDDGFSHNGNYEVTLKPKNVDFSRAAAVPEPSVMLGLLSVAGIFVSKRREKKA
ncbi:MAG: NF038130 family PEP-CTERM protein [Cyanobacteria bacterium P01_D01_bin.50]